MVRIFTIASLLIILLAGTAIAEPSGLSLGLGSYAIIVDYDVPGVAEDQFMGAGIVGTFAFNDNMAVRGMFFSTTHEDFDELESKGIDAQVLFGSHLLRQGFKFYGSGGFFSETWEAGTVELDFSGLTVGFGLGYNWEKVALDWWGAWRAPSDYEELFEELGADISIMAAAGSLSLSFRF